MASKNRIDIILGFTADTKQANTQMNQLQNELKRLSTYTQIDPTADFKKGITEANAKIVQLSGVLKDAFNVETGKLDVNKFLYQMEQYGMTLKDVQNTFESFGAEGVQAWRQLNAQIAQGDTHLISLNETMKSLYEQFLRTAKMNISYAVLRSITNGFKDAYNYAKDLNESLNNIRIVTGASTEKMAAFAKEASSAAKALSATTVEYTDAALIYYQQGLNDEEVKARTDTTIKLANVTGTTAEETSSYLTAIWNNFAVGSENLEYYADVITKLGAATASSSEEIATGLSHFAAVADTVGLSYEYATAALATVVAQTRQSADTVGNSFKTIFARLESLSIGETLEDGTGLTKYTQALEAVGVNIKLSNGELKNMDNILDELGDKWNNLTQEQKNALAYTVAGARQYTNFIALMDNYDTMKQNVNLAKTAEGSLEEQNQIYAESWEASMDRVTASFEKLYNYLINDKFFITINNSIATVVDWVAELVKNIGGLKTVLPLVVSLLTKAFNSNIVKTTQELMQTVGTAKKMLTGAGEEAKQTGTENLANSISDSDYTIKWNLNETQELVKNTLNSMAQKANYGPEKEIAKFISSTMTNLNDLLLQKNDYAISLAEDAQNLAKLQQKQTALGKDSKSAGVFAKIRVKDKNATFTGKELQDTYGIDIKSAGVKLDEIVTKEKALKIVKDEQAKVNKEINEYNAKISDTLNIQLKTAELQKQLDTEKANLSQAQLENNEEVIKQIEERIKNLQSEMETVEGQIQNVNKMSEELKPPKDQVRAQNIVNTVQAITGLISVSNSLESTWTNIQNLDFEGTLSSAASSVLSFSMQFKQFQELAASLSGKTGLLGSIGKGFESLLSKGFGLAFIKVAAVLMTIKGALWAIKSVIEHFNNLKPENQLKKWTDAAENLKNHIDTVNQAYENLQSTLEELESTKDSLKDLDKDSVEYQKLVLESNQKSIELLKEWGKLDPSNYTIDADGLIQISKETLEEINKESLNNIESATGAYYEALVQGYQISETIAKQDASKKLKNKYLQEEVITSTRYEVDSITGDVVEKEETTKTNSQKDITEEIVSSLIDAVISNNSDNLSEEQIRESLDKIGASESIIERVIADYNDQSSDLRTTITEAIIAIDENTLAKKAAEKESNKVLFKDLIDEYNTDENNNKYKLSYDVLASDEFDNIVSPIRDKINNDFANTLNNNNKLKQWIIDNQTLLGVSEITKDKISIDGDKITVDGQEFNKAGISAINLTDTINNSPTLYQDIVEQLRDLSNKFKPNDNYVGNDSTSGKAKKDISNYDLDEEAINELATSYAKLHEAEGMTYEQARNIIIANEKLNKGYKDLIDNFEDYKDILSNSNKLSVEYGETVKSLQKDIGAITDIDADNLSEAFVTSEETLKLLEQAANGSVEALEELKIAATLDLAENVLNLHFSTDEAEGKLDELKALINNADWTDLEIGANTDAAANQIINFLNKMVENADMSVEEASEILSGLGWEPEIEYKKVTWSSLQTQGYTGKVSRTSDGANAEDMVDIKGSATLTADTEVYIPVIKGSTTRYKGPTAGNISSSTRQSLNKNKGGSSQKSAKNIKDELERYYEINQQLDEINNNLDRISKYKDRAFGKKRLEYLDQEIAQYERLAQAQQRYLDEAKSYLSSDMSALAAYGAIFNSDGTLANYNDLINNQVNAYNAALSDEAEEQYNNFKEALSNYEDSLSKVQSESLALIEATNQLYDAKLEKITYEVEYKIHIDDRDIEYLEWLLNQVDENSFDVAESIALLTKQAEDNQKKYETIMTGINKWRAGHTEISDAAWNNFISGAMSAEEIAAMFTTITEDEKNQLEEWADSLMDVSDALQEVSDKIQDQIVHSIDTFNAKLNNQKRTLENLNTILTTYDSIIELLGLDLAGVSKDIYNSMGDAMVNIAKKNLEINKIAYEAQAQAYLENMNNDALTEETKNSIRDAYYSAAEEYVNSLQEALNQVAEQFSRQLNLIVDEYNKKMGGIYGSLSNLRDAFNKQNKLDDLYLDKYKQTYELSKLLRNINNSIDDTASIKGKQVLAGLLNEINDIQEAGTKINEYDLQVMQRKYDLYLAQIALEEAQNAKSEVRMTRDSEGNMSYTYVANQDAITNAQQNYDDKLFALEDVTQQRIDSIQEMILSAMEEYINEISQLNITDQERVDLINNHYAELQETYGVFMNQAIMDADWIVKELQVDEKELINSFDETTLSHVYNIQTMDELNQLYYETASDLIYQLKDDYETFTTETEELTAQLEAAIQDHLNRVNEETTTAGETVQNMADDFKTAFNEAIDAANTFNTKYAAVMNNIKESTRVAVNALNTLLAAMAETGQGNFKSNFSLDGLVAQANAQTANIRSNGGGRDNDPPDGGDTPKVEYPAKGPFSSNAHKSNSYVKNLANLIIDDKDKTKGIYIKGTYIKTFDTGGYTGSWGPNGKLAMLHEKELVLNKQDTNNILGAVNLVRDLVGNLTNLGSLKSFSFNNMLNNLIPSFDTGEQNITINADFPNVSSKDEIKEAFKELALTFSQYTNRKA